MELACKVFFGLLILFSVTLVAGFIDVWWEQRKRDRERKR